MIMLVLVLSGCQSAKDTNLVPAIVYLGWDENEQIQVYRQSLGDESKQVTTVEAGVFEYAVAPDGETIAYSTMVVDGSSSLRQIGIDGRGSRLLLMCEQAVCGQIVWADDNRRLIYEKRPIGDDGIPGSTYLWWLDTETGETQTVLEDQNARGTGARFSPDGQWLSYVSPEEQGAILYHLTDGRSHFVADEIGVPAAWSPAGDQVIVPNLDLVIIHGEDGDDHLQHAHEYETATHLFAFNMEDGEVENISGDLRVEDSAPAWSPDGEWIAFGRRFAGTSAGRQLWLMNSDGSDQQVLLDDPGITYGPPSWSPDGRYLLFQQFVLDDAGGDPGIWLLDIESGQAIEMIAGAMQPAWLIETIGLK